MLSQETKKSKGVWSRSADAAKGAETPALVAADVGSADEAPPAPQSSSQPRPQKKGAKKDGKKRRRSHKPRKSQTAPPREKGPPVMTQESPKAASNAHAAVATAEQKALAMTSLGQQSSLYPSSAAPPDLSASEAREAVQQEPPPDAPASFLSSAGQHHRTSTTCKSRAVSQRSKASRAPSTWTREESMKALTDLLTSGKDAPFSTHHTPSLMAVDNNHEKASTEALVFAVMLLAGVLVALTVFLLPRPVPKTGRFCATKACAQHRDLIESQLNKNLDPCDDFAAYVCSRWRPREEFTYQSRSALMDMVMAWQANVPNTLHNGASQLPAGRKAAAMFNSCMTQTGSQVDVFKKFMSQHGLAWPEDPVGNGIGPVEILFDLAFNWYVNLWFSLALLPLATDGHQNKRRLFFAPNNLMLEWRTIFRQIPRRSFDEVYSAMFKLFSISTDASPPPQRITEDYNRLQYIFDLFILSGKGKAVVPAVLPLRELDSLTDLTNATYIKHAIDTQLAIQPPFTMEDLMLTSDGALLNAVLSIFGKIDDTGVRRHLAWLFLEAYAPVANLDTALLILHGDKRHAEESRPLFCAREVEASYKLQVAAMAAVTRFSEEERQRVDDLLAGIVEEAAEKASSAPWLDNETQHVAAEKLRGVQSVLWPDKKFLTANGLEEAYAKFPDKASSFADFWIQTRRSLRGLIGSEAGLQELQIGDSWAQPYAQYVHVLNQLSLSMGALAPPIYYKDGTKAMLYGGLGYFYAMELVGAVDSEGVKVDPLGNIVSSWLSENVKPTFHHRVRGCLPGGNASVFPEVPAMEVAFAAFKRNLGDHDVQLSEVRNSKRLAGRASSFMCTNSRRELTEEKVFFITACLLSCSKTPSDNLYGGDCNKAVANFAPFAKAFKCRPGSNMNHIRKCTFFD